MNNAYSISRHDLLEWINILLSTDLTKIEQLGSGSIYCQILDAAYPDKVPLSKVKWNAYLEVDFLHNFKVLQTAFQKLGISKTI
jgi:microtubule-associated protein, RP/EB family